MTKQGKQSVPGDKAMHCLKFKLRNCTPLAEMAQTLVSSQSTPFSLTALEISHLHFARLPYPKRITHFLDLNPSFSRPESCSKNQITFHQRNCPLSRNKRFSKNLKT